MTRRKGKEMSDEKRLRIASVDLIKSKSPNKRISSLRIQEVGNYTELINQLKKFPNELTCLPLGTSKRTLEQMNSAHLTFVSQEVEIMWCKSILIQNIDQINEFLKFSREFSNLVLAGNYSGAMTVLNQVETNFGQSLWLIKNKIAILQKTKGLEAHKEYVYELKRKLNDNKLLKFIIHWISIRNEDNTSVVRFQSRINRILNTFTDNSHPGFYQYCKHHLLGEVIPDPNEFSHILRIDYSRSFIDLYESYVRFLGVFLYKSESQLKFNSLLHGLINRVEDKRIQFLERLESQTNIEPNFPDKSIYEVVNRLFLNGDYHGAFKASNDYIQTNKIKPELLILAGKFHATLKEGSTEINNDQPLSSLSDEIIFHISQLYKKGISGGKESVEKLRKLSLNYSHLMFSCSIKFAVNLHLESFYQQNENDFLNIIASAEFCPIYLTRIHQSDLSKKYIETCRKIYPYIDSSTQELDLKPFSELLDSINERSDAYISTIAELNYKKQKFTEAIQLAKKLLKSDSSYFFRKGIGILTYSSLKVNNYHDALIHSVDTYLDNHDLHYYLPIPEILYIAQPATEYWNNLCANIEFPIIWDVYTKYYDYSAELQRSYAYEDFLYSNNMKKPSEITSRFSEFDKRKTIYFLREICVEQNMDTSDAFENGAKEVLQERLNVCRILSKIDKENESLIQSEISEIISRQVITKNTREFDNSRVQVDTVNIKSWAVKELEESFNRYQAYINNGITITAKKKENSSSRRLNNQSLTVPKDEVHALLRGMVEDIVEAYLAPEYGLDRFLSTRIRHGKLDRHLRRPLTLEKLITKRESEKGKYLKNEYLLSLMKNSSDVYISSQISQIASAFSKDFDGFISEIANDWIQIKSLKKPNGLFNFQIQNEDIINISKEIGPDTSLKEFVDFVISLLNHLLVVNLSIIREELNTVGKKRGRSLLTKLQKDLSKFSEHIWEEEVISAINRSKTSLQVQFDKVTGWFVPSTSSESPPFTLVDAIDVAMADLKEDGANINIEINVEGEAFQIHGSLPHFVDIFINLLDNIHKRSGLDEPSGVVHFKFDIEENDVNYVFVKISNPISVSKNIAAIQEVLDKKKTLMSSGNYTGFIAKDKGSGLFKTFKAVSDIRIQGRDVRSELDFGVITGEFWVTMKIPFKLLSLDLEDTNSEIKL